MRQRHIVLFDLTRTSNRTCQLSTGGRLIRHLFSGFSLRMWVTTVFHLQHSAELRNVRLFYCSFISFLVNFVAYVAHIRSIDVIHYDPRHNVGHGKDSYFIRTFNCCGHLIIGACECQLTELINKTIDQLLHKYHELVDNKRIASLQGREWTFSLLFFKLTEERASIEATGYELKFRLIGGKGQIDYGLRILLRMAFLRLESSSYFISSNALRYVLPQDPSVIQSHYSTNHKLKSSSERVHDLLTNMSSNFICYFWCPHLDYYI